MVYCGPPSKGCSNCRDRKIRCDQREPGCGQCEKRQQKCPGYRNMVDLMFRDESSHVIKKAQARQQRRRVASARTPDPAPSPDADSTSSVLSSSSSSTTLAPPRTPTLPSTPAKPEGRLKALTLLTPGVSASSNHGSASDQALFPTLPSQAFDRPQGEMERNHDGSSLQLVWTRDESLLPSPGAGSWPTTPMIVREYNLEPTLQERGTAFFFSRYVAVDNNALHQRFDFLYDIWRPGSLAAERQLDGVMASMTAVGLFGTFQLTHSREIIESARMSYGAVLRLSHKALDDPDETIRDATMLSTLILGVYEMMEEPGLGTMETWQNHINGAVQMATKRGTSQFRTRAGTRMFNMLCQSVTISCLQRAVPMPAEVVALQKELLSSTMVEHEPGGFGGIDLLRPMYKLLQARHDVKRAGLLIRLDELLARLHDIEAEFESTIESFPEDCRYKYFRAPRAHKAVFRDVCHIYPSIATASVWNWLRAARILVLETVLFAVQQHYPDAGEDGELVPQQYLAACRQAWTKIERVNSAIVASVPQHFGLLNPVNPYFGSLKPMPIVVAPLSTTEVREPPTPPAQSPISSAGSAHTPSVHSDDRGEGGSGQPFRDDDEMTFDDGGPTLDNPTRAQNVHEEAERYMLLASATNAIVWPLYMVGVSSVCSPQLKAYVVGRLCAVFDETGLSQARSLASVVRNRELVKSPWLKLLQRTSSSMPPPSLGAIRKSLSGRLVSEGQM